MISTSELQLLLSLVDALEEVEDMCWLKLPSALNPWTLLVLKKIDLFS